MCGRVIMSLQCPRLPRLAGGSSSCSSPAPRGLPAQYTELVERAALLGYHAVSLDYENSESINFEVCRNQPPDCYEQARLEILTGAESPYIEPDVDLTNSAFNRLTRLLEQQADAHPDEGWDAYLAGGDLRWDMVAVGGHPRAEVTPP